jgi:hypothetical protein
VPVYDTRWPTYVSIAPCASAASNRAAIQSTLPQDGAIRAADANGDDDVREPTGAGVRPVGPRTPSSHHTCRQPPVTPPLGRPCLLTGQSEAADAGDGGGKYLSQQVPVYDTRWPVYASIAPRASAASDRAVS